jgi:hypothetical protein
VIDKSAKRLRAFRVSTLIAIAALILEFLLGMYTALFVQFPDSLSQGNAWAWSMSQSAVTLAHIVIGTALVGVALASLGLGLAARSRAAILSSSAGLLLTGLAYMSGAIFLSNIESDAYSFSMAIGFIGAILAYGIGYHRTQP